MAAVVLALVVAGGWWLWPRPPSLPAFDGPQVAVPSGMEVRYLDTVQDHPGTGLTYRFRFVAPSIKPGSSETVQDDMQALCDGFAIARIPSTGPQPSEIVISLSDRPLDFGKPAPDAVQFFEAYRPENGKCVWELF